MNKKLLLNPVFNLQAINTTELISIVSNQRQTQRQSVSSNPTGIARWQILTPIFHEIIRETSKNNQKRNLQAIHGKEGRLPVRQLILEY